MFGICHISSYEGEAPVRLQAASEGRRGQNRADLVEVISGHPNFVRLLLALSEYADKRQAAADFQETLAQVLAKRSSPFLRKSKSESLPLGRLLFKFIINAAAA